jgi:ComEC/Rec2-related protein
MNILPKILRDIFPGLLYWSRMPAFSGWIALSAGIVAGKAATFPALPDTTEALLICAVVLLTVLSLIFSRSIVRIPAFLAIGFLLMILRTSEERNVFGHWRECFDENSRTCTLSGRSISPPLDYYGQYRFLVKADSLYDSSGVSAFAGKTLVCITDVPVPGENTLVLHGRYVPPRPRTNPGGYDQFTFYLSSDLWGTFYADSIAPGRALHPSAWRNFASRLRSLTLATLDHVKDDDRRALLQASFLGEKEVLSPEMSDSFRNAGIYHLLALSGFNVAMMVGFILFLLAPIPLRKDAKIAIAIAGIWIYLFFIGMIPSLVRATIMATIVLGSFLVQRKSHPLNALGLAGVIWLMLMPESLFTPGYQLSFAATFGIIAFPPVVDGITRSLRQGTVRSFLMLTLWLSLLVSLSAFIATLPVLVCHFGVVSLFGIIANLVAIPLMTASLWALFAGIVLQAIFPPLAGAAVWISDLFMNGLIKTAELTNYMPVNSLLIPNPYPEMVLLFLVFFVGLLTIARPFRARYALAAGVAVVLIAAFALFARSAGTDAEITFFSAKDPGITGIRWPNHKLWIIGRGDENRIFSSYERIILPWLRRHPLDRLDAIIVPDSAAESILFAEPIIANRSSVKIIPVNSATIDGPACFTPAPGCSCRLAIEPECIGLSIRGTTLEIAGRGSGPCGPADFAAIVSSRRFEFASMRDAHTFVWSSARKNAKNRVQEDESLDKRGSCTIVINKKGTVRIISAIEPSHPLARQSIYREY